MTTYKEQNTKTVSVKTDTLIEDGFYNEVMKELDATLQNVAIPVLQNQLVQKKEDLVESNMKTYKEQSTDTGEDIRAERQARKERQQEEILDNQALTKMFYRDEKSQERQARKEVQEEDILDNIVLPILFDKDVLKKREERQARKEVQEEDILDNKVLPILFDKDVLKKREERQARKEVQEEDILDNKVLPRLFEKHNSVIGKFKHAIGKAADRTIGAYNVAKDRIWHAIGVVTGKIKNVYNVAKDSIGHAIVVVTDKTVGAYNIVKHSIGNAYNRAKIWVKSIVSKDSGTKKQLNIDIDNVIDDGEFSLTNPNENSRVVQKEKTEGERVETRLEKFSHLVAKRKQEEENVLSSVPKVIPLHSKEHQVEREERQKNQKADILDSFDGDLENLFQEAVPTVRTVKPSAPPLPAKSIASAGSISTDGSMTPLSDIEPGKLSTTLLSYADAKREYELANPDKYIKRAESTDSGISSGSMTSPPSYEKTMAYESITLPSYEETMAMEQTRGTISSPTVPTIVATKTQTTADMFKSMTAGLYNVVSNAVSNTVSSAANTASNAVTSATNTLSSAANAISGAAANAATSATNTLSSAANTASNAISSAANALSNNTLSNTLGDAVSSAFTDTTQPPLSQLDKGVGVTKVDQRVAGITNHNNYSI